MAQDLPLRLRTKAHRHHCQGEAVGREGDEQQGPRQDRVVKGVNAEQVDSLVGGKQNNGGWAYTASLSDFRHGKGKIRQSCVFGEISWIGLGDFLNPSVLRLSPQFRFEGMACMKHD